MLSLEMCEVADVEERSEGVATPEYPGDDVISSHWSSVLNTFQCCRVEDEHWIPENDVLHSDWSMI